MINLQFKYLTRTLFPAVLKFVIAYCAISPTTEMRNHEKLTFK